MGTCGSHESSDFSQFLYWAGVVVLKQLIVHSFYIGRVWWSGKNYFLSVSTLGRFGGLEITAFLTVCILGRCGGLERTDCSQFLLWEGVVVLK